MLGDEFSTFLSDAEQARPHCFCRQPEGTSLWLDACLFAAEHAGDEAIARLSRAADAADALSPTPWVERPSQLLRQALEQVLLAWGRPVGPLAQAAGGAGVQVAAWRGAWLQHAAGHAPAASPAQRWRLDAPTCSLPVLLDGGSQGVVATLTLWRMPQRGGGLRFVPAPASAVTPLDREFQSALATVSTWLLGLLCAADGTEPVDTVIGWDLAPRSVAFMGLRGPSAGAAFALGALWLLRAQVPDRADRLRENLALMHETALRRVAVSAGLDARGHLVRVGGLPAKVDSLRLFAHALGAAEPLLVRVAEDQPPLPVADTAVDGPSPPRLKRHATLPGLVADVAATGTPFTPAQATLFATLLSPQAARPVVDARVLARVDQDDPCSAVAHYLLKRWAHWALEQDGRLHACFVPLAVTPELRPADKTGKPQVFYDLAQFLADAGRPPAGAWLLRGASGSGKTTLLRHLEQELCLKALRQLAAGHEPEELPLYVRLSALPPANPAHDSVERRKAEVQGWLRQHVRDNFPLLPALPDLLSGAVRRGPRLRLLLDGLNELKVPPGGDREQRAREVVHACIALLGGQRVQPVLCTRSHHPFDLRDAQLKVVPVDVQPLQPADIKLYLERRFPDSDTAQRHWNALQANTDALELCRVPMHLDGQCELLEEPDGVLQAERASLYATWLWQRLWRATRRDGAEPVEAVLFSARLLEPADHARINDRPAWLGHGWRDLPAQGWLLKSLFRQADAQWRQAARDGLGARARGDVEVDLRTVAPWLDEADPTGTLRTNWLQAVQDLGLVRIESGRFKFTHQSWGEFLASRHLLTATPQQMAQAGTLAAFMAELAPPPFARRDAEEIEHLRQQVQQAWARVPQAVWDGLLSAGVTIPTQVLLDWLANVGRSSVALQADLDFLRRWAGYTERDDGVNCHVSLQKWGDGDLRVNAFGREWWRHPAAWSELAGVLWEPFAAPLWAELERALGQDGREALQTVGQLDPAPAGDLDEPLTLALQALEDPLPWLQQLCAAGLLRAAAQGVLAMHKRLEPEPWTRPLPLLQHLRRLLLLQSVDAGAAVRGRVAAAGVLQALAHGLPAAGTALHTAWQQALGQAFRCAGVDVRQRIDAALLLGRLGDTLRYERVPGHGGLRLRPCHWVPVGADVRAKLLTDARPKQRGFDIGDAGSAERDERPAKVSMPGFAVAAFAVTVAEWQAFVDAGGYASPELPWWRDEGAAAQAWLRERLAEGPQSEAKAGPWTLGHSGLNNPLQPVTGITWFEARAFVRWAAPLVESPGSRWRLRMPTEVEWEAGMRGPRVSAWSLRRWLPDWQRAEKPGEPQALRFNHAATRWGRPTPVGVFSPGYTPTGIADSAGNTWDWCANLYQPNYQPELGPQAGGPRPKDDAGRTPRALRGGGCDSAAGDCRVACRNHYTPGYLNYYVGLRLVRVWLPHSEP
jgi:formylglycine-generating enzyme required for sulfatase activity